MRSAKCEGGETPTRWSRARAETAIERLASSTLDKVIFRFLLQPPHYFILLVDQDLIVLHSTRAGASAYAPHHPTVMAHAPDRPYGAPFLLLYPRAITLIVVYLVLTGPCLVFDFSAKRYLFKCRHVNIRR